MDSVEQVMKGLTSEEVLNEVARAIMEARVRHGWTFGKRPRVMGIDLVMADDALKAVRARLLSSGGEG